MRPSSTAAMAGSASGAIFTYHWSVSQGSSTAPLRSPRGTGSECGSILLDQAGGFQLRHHALARLEAVEAEQFRGNLAGRQALPAWIRRR